MKAIIQGKRYDTEKAELIGRASSDCGKSDFRYFREELYVTPRSRTYFIAGEGGPLSRWAERVDNSYTNGKGIKPLSMEDAIMWAETYLDVHDIQKHFGNAINDA